jgi:peptide/nickel transport system substrate-binding protein
VRCHLKNPDAIFLSAVVYYPVSLMAPGSADTADTNPQGCGPFKFKSWKRFDTTVLERFENFWETDAKGNPLPYLDGFVGKPKKEDAVRLTALRTGEVDLIDNMAYADAAGFKKDYADRFNTWDVPHVGTSYVSFNMKNGPFSYQNPDGHMLRQAVAHAIDHEGIHQAIFNSQGEIAKGFYSKSSPWYAPDIESWPEYDLDKAKSLRKKAKDGDAKITIVARQAYAYMHQTGEIVHSMLKEAGFNVAFEIHPNPVLREKYKKGDFDIDSSANSYRIDPDAWYGRALLSTAATNKTRRGYKNEQVDQLIIAARSELSMKKRHQMYADVDSIVNRDLPLIYSHYVPLIEAGALHLKDYKPAFAGPFQYSQGGLRVAWLDK